LEKNCKYLEIRDKRQLKELKISSERLLAFYLEYISNYTNLQLFEDMSNIIDYVEFKTLGEVTKGNLINIDNRILFKKVELGKMFLPIKELHIDIDRRKKREYVDQSMIKELSLNLDKEVIVEALAIIDKNQGYMYALESITKNNMRKLLEFYRSDNIKTIVEFLAEIEQQLFFLKEDKDDFSEFQFNIEQYITWKWLSNNEIIKVFAFLKNKDIVRDVEETSKEIIQIQNFVEKILDDYN